MAKSKFFRAFVEGGTVSDGRKIEAGWIDEIVANFNTATYSPRINCEHIRGFSPEPPFNAYGDVVAVRAQTDDIEIGGKTEKRRALYCQVEGNDQFVAIRKAGQKPYPSVEISPNYGDTGKFGLVGLGITDNPASLGTEAITFSALQPVFDGRKQNPANLFSAIDDFSEVIDFEDPAPQPDAGAFADLKAFLSGLVTKKVDPPAPAPVEIKPDDAMAAFNAKLAEGLGGIVKLMETQFGAVTAENAKLTARFTALETKLATTEADPGKRTRHSGGDGTILADF